MARHYVWLGTLLAMLAVAGSLLIPNPAAAAVWVPLNGVQAQEEAPHADILRCDYQAIQIDFSLSGFSHETVATKGGSFSRMMIGDEGYTTEIGQPQLPVIRRMIEIPYGAQADLIVGQITVRQGTLAEFGLNQGIIPVQPPVVKVPGALEAAPFVLDQAAYARSGYTLGQRARLSDEGYLRGHHFVLLEIFPVDYSPADGRLLFTAEIEIQINLTKSDFALTRQMKARYADLHTRALARKLFLNYGSYEEDLIPTPLGLLIITSPHNAGLPIVQEFVNWKEQKGFHTTLATTSETGTTTNQIKAYIQNAYDNWPIPPNFVLLIGDTDILPYWPASGPGTDLYYATLEGGDYFNDVGIGRLSPSNDANLANMINKTLDYEQVGWTGNDEWEKWAVFMASNDNWTVSEGTHNFVIENYLAPDGYRYSKLYCHTYGATTQQVTDNINAGRSLAIYSGHGSVTSWADGPPFSQSNVQALVNTVYPLVTSHACLTGQYMAGECFGETWIRTSHGTMVFWGSVDYTYWGEDDILEKGMFEGFFDEQSPQQDQNLTWVAGMTDYAKFYLWQNYGGGGMSQSYWEQYNILGDPTVDIWTNIPQNLTVGFPAAILIGQTSLTVNVSGYPDWAMVNVYSDAEDLRFTEYVTAGSVTFGLGTGFTVPGTLHVWVTGHDCAPYHGTASIIPPSGAYVIFDSLVVEDSPMGNGNGQLDYSETSELTIYAKNVGSATAINVFLDIATEDTLLTIIDGSEFLGTLEAGAVGATNRGFTVQASSQLPDGHVLLCHLTAISQTNVWYSDFALPGHAPQVEFDSLIVHDDTGNQNGCLDPGENALMEIILKNNGSSTVENVSISVFYTGPYIVIYSGTATVGTLAPGQTGSGTISVSASPSCPWSYSATFDMGIFGGSGYETAENFTTIVGNPLYAPVGPDAYGYLAYDNYDGAEAPVFNWIEIVPAPGTPIAYTTDDQTFQFNLPFAFRYYGQDFTQISVCSNGWIAMGSTTSVDWSNTGIPNGDGPPNMIAPFWEDLSPQLQGTVAYYFNAAQHYYLVEFSGVRQYTPSSALETFEIVLYDPAYYPTATGDGQILFQYNQVSDPSSCTTGIENGSQTVGLQYLLDGAYDPHAAPLAAGRAILFQTVDIAGGAQITLTPSGLPIQIPAAGGSFNFNLAAANTGAAPITGDIWCMITLPAGTSYGPVLGPVNVNMPAGWSSNRDRTQNVPGSAPAGDYTYHAYVGLYPGTIWDQDNFPFTKLTTGNGAWVGDWENFGESFDEWLAAVDAKAVPEVYSLGQNYPNPFNPLTTLSFSLPQAAQVTLAVYDLQGRVVAQLVNGMRPAGVHEVTWDASQQASGMYFCRIQAGDFTAIRKMMLVK